MEALMAAHLSQMSRINEKGVEAAKKYADTTVVLAERFIDLSRHIGPVVLDEHPNDEEATA